MSIHVALNHVTHYRYDRRVALGPQVVRLRPAPHCRTPILSYSLRIEPVVHFVNWQQDPFANHLARLVFPAKTTEFKVTVDLVAEMAVYNPFDFFLEEGAEHFPFDYEEATRRELAPYLVKGVFTPRFEAFVKSVPRHDPKGADRQRTIDFLVGLNQRLQREIRYLIRMEPGVQTPEQTLANGSGSCRDTGWLLVQALRHLGLAARFVSGYLIQLKPDVKSLDGPSGAESDFTDLHAWCEVFLPGAGWIGLDPTSGLMAGEGHIPLACTPEPSSAAPVSGAVDASEVEFGHTMRISRVFESPRVTRPYSEAQWADVLALGHRVDAALSAGDVRLTQGGEPTFVSVADREGAEWNTAALGPTKRGFANELVQKLRARYGAGGFLHFGQGKWYPGEQLPRWALSIFWRRDGEPCWADPTRFADERLPSSYTEEDAKRFIDTLAGKLGLAAAHIRPGYEDSWYYLWRERRLPVNVDPFDARLDDELERARLRKVFEQGLKKVVGWMLPLARAEGAPALAGPRWTTGPWFLRDERMYLMPGDSPMGWRLPLDSLPWVSKADFPYLIEADPFAPAAPLHSPAALRAQYGEHAMGESARGLAGLRGPVRAGEPPGGDAPPGPRGRTDAGAAGRAPARFESAQGSIRTALVVEARGGILYVFMPPLAALDDYLDLLAAVEASAEALDVKLVLEGYPPPRDARLTMLQVTPDPGVIEVNIHPAHDWAELVDHTEFLYQAAHETRLSTEKFMLDGRHTGTGGGNHFVLGGATPPDSPFLRRPDLLASLLAYWHNHPSLSYLFSGMFIGPTSQAPRIDEARNDQVVELEIALEQIEQRLAGQGHVAPWMVDRALRNILVDVTGNTHRAEFCIDKLYSPDGPTGRLGLLELRAFEMPPHARMSLVQQLLLRALIAWFWHEPYPGRAGRGPGPVAGQTRLTRWGTELHDRFLLPSFVQQDFDDVLADLGRAGHAFDAAWFAPHFEFRFPRIGEVAVGGVTLALRCALEPWHVMGEEGSAGGTVRYVDSSLERLEVRVSGLNGNRHVVTVNGQALPLQPLGTASVKGQSGGTQVAGVRYKAWAPPSALHPTIPTHAPLTFDVVDAWNARSLGGCRYHVAHPGGRNHDSFPVNAYEAESRRLARFFTIGHTPGPMQVRPAMPSREFPFTLDLRKSG
ncbi:MAG TPA: transglutaminase family protein [Methylibium sp.]|uniref:transglutaminase family protein n=1 Tax=Methylibium sp. TaxID=2067992 RepID=UPI002DBDC130|nr:transglutaminase family protein [Methylibium sp.]HEU4459412.1 transglutaminase family protein [Methylibium sp.]